MSFSLLFDSVLFSENGQATLRDHVGEAVMRFVSRAP